MDGYAPGGRRSNAKDCARDIAAPRAHEAAETDDLALPHLEADIVEEAGPGEVLDLERDLADRRAMLLHVFAQRPADHQPDDIAGADVRYGVSGYGRW